MKLNNASLQSPAFKIYLEKAGFLAPDGKLAAGSLGKYPGEISLSDAYIDESGGLLRAISRKAAEILRSDLGGLQIRKFSEECKAKWRYILMHHDPHLDEYLSSYLLRSCLPDEMNSLIQDEVILFSRDNDHTAQAIWPHAAVLGVGNVINGGTQPLLLFDEHGAAGEEKAASSLVMLMKRYMFGTQRPPFALYQMIKEINYIDQYGCRHPKTIAAYAKYLNTIPLPTANNARMTTEWKCAVIDACLVSLYLGIRDQAISYKNRLSWEPFMRQSLEDYAARTSLRNEVDFAKIYRKINNFLIDTFAFSVSKGGAKYMIPNLRNPQKATETELNMLVPYIPHLMFRFWGGVLGQILLFPLWECRLYREMLNTRCYKVLNKLISTDTKQIDTAKTEIGTLSMICCQNAIDSEHSIKIVDFAPVLGLNSPAPLNQYIRIGAGGYGLSIFRNVETNTIVLSKGDKISPELWEKICDRLVKLEGQSDDLRHCGAWHVTRSPTGLAPFLLNGSSTHRYVPESRITVCMLAKIVDECLSEPV